MKDRNVKQVMIKGRVPSGCRGVNEEGKGG
jgi:hypothetical protein